MATISKRKRNRVVRQLETAIERIAAETKVSPEIVREIAKRKRPFESRAQKKARRAKLEQQIIELRRSGMNNKAIARKLKMRRSKISMIAAKLIQEEKITRLSFGRKPMPKSDREERKASALRLREQGASQEAIAEALGLAVSTVQRYFPLPAEQDQFEVGSNSKSSVRDLNCERTQTIIAMVVRGATLQQIGDKLKLTRERARQLIREVRTIHGDAVFNASEEEPAKVWTIAEAAALFNVSKSTIDRIRQSGAIVCMRRGSTKTGAFQIDETNLNILRTHPLLTGNCICEVCEQEFNPGIRARKRKVCENPDCVEQRRIQRKQYYATIVASAENLRGWHKKVFVALSKLKPPETSGLLPLSAAAKRARISNTQLHWLSRRRIVTVRLHSTKTWRGRPLCLYLASEMNVIRDIVQTNGATRPK